MLAEDKEWAEAEDSEEDDDAPNWQQKRESQVYNAREQRFSMSQAQLEKELALADAEVNVVSESKEWSAGVDSDDDASPTKLEKNAAQAFEEREKRITISQEQLQKELMMADQEVDVVAEIKEWAAAGDSDEEEGPNHLEQRASQAFTAREKRLTVGAERLSQQMIISDAEVKILAESKEWAEADDDTDDDAPGPQQLQTQQHDIPS